MQGKGIVKLFLVLITIVSLIQLFYFIPTNKVEKNAEAYGKSMAEGVQENLKYETEKLGISNYLDSMSSETVLSIPLLKDYSYAELKQRQLAFGLDLKGGMSAVLEVDLKEFLRTLAGNKKSDPDFVAAMSQAKAAQASSQSDYITLFSNAFQQIAPNKKLAKIFGKSEVLGDINVETTNGEVTRMLREKANETVSLTFKMLKERIDRLGVAQPNISLDAARDLILVEVPGIDNPKRLEKMLQATAQLEFWETYRINDPGILDALTEANRRLTEEIGGETATKMDTSYTYSYDPDGNVSDSTQVITESADIFGSQGPLFSKLQVNGSGGQFNNALTVLGIASKYDTSKVMKLLAQENVKALFPNNSELMWSYSPYKDRDGVIGNDFELYLIKKRPGLDKAPLEGDVIVDANQGVDPNTGEVEVTMQMNSKGAKEWARMTTDAFSNGKREIAIALDKKVVSAPGLRTGPITGGSSSISGSFSIQEAIDFANILEVGKLPAGTNIIQKSTVGPSLGQANINSSLKSLAVGFGLLLLFMLFYYAGGGIVSIIALLANLLFIFGALSSFGTVLTLPGIAGIVLTIGMAVDANVIIFERIREELRSGKSNLSAIVDGFKNSYSAIIDANVTTLLTAMVLAYFGLGPIKGFAVVLGIGVISSLFTAVAFGRFMLDSYTSRGKEVSFWTGATKNVFANLNIDWLGKRKIAYVVSGILIVASLVSIFTRSFDFGVDFKGGYSYSVEFPESANIDPEAVKSGLAEVFGKAPVVKQIDAANTLNITTQYLVENNDKETDTKVLETLLTGLNTITGTNTGVDAFTDGSVTDGLKLVSSNKVGPTIADDIKDSSWLAGIFALLLIFLYIFLRFNKWQFSLGAVAALFHDSIIVLGLFSMFHGILPFSLEVDQAFIAALLTVIGYSINDTVVVFDRIREFLGIYTNKHKDEVINMAINSTFSRTLITSFTTLLVVGTLLLFGGGAIKGFAFALLVGVLVGTYSSIFVATPIVRDLSDDLRMKSPTASAKANTSSFGRSKSTAE